MTYFELENYIEELMFRIEELKYDLKAMKILRVDTPKNNIKQANLRKSITQLSNLIFEYEKELQELN